MECFRGSETFGVGTPRGLGHSRPEGSTTLLDIFMESLNRQREDKDYMTRYWGLTKYPNHRKVSKILLRIMLKSKEVILRRVQPAQNNVVGI